MNKPTLVKDIAVLMVLNLLFFAWLFWYLVFGGASISPITILGYVVLFAVIELVYIFNFITRYKDAYKVFTQNIKAMGNKTSLVDYKVQTYEVNGDTNYYITAEVDFAGKKKRIRKSIPKELGKRLVNHPVPLSLYIDPSSTRKFTYFLDLPVLSEKK